MTAAHANTQKKKQKHNRLDRNRPDTHTPVTVINVLCMWKGQQTDSAHFHSVCVCEDTGGAVQLEAGHHTVRRGAEGGGAGFVVLKKCHKTALLNWWPIKLASARALDFLCLCLGCWPHSELFPLCYVFAFIEKQTETERKLVYQEHLFTFARLWC